MHIFIDARFYGTEHTGLGRYTKNVLDHLRQNLQGQALKVTILLHPKYHDLQFGKSWHVITSTVRPYSLAEQLTVPYLVKKSGADLYVGFHFSVPLLVGVPFITVIHDLIKSYSVGPDTTTRSPLIYRLKRWGYELTMGNTVNHALKLIVPTNTVKNDILARYNLEPSRIIPIPEAPDPALANLRFENLRFDIPKHYLLFVGNAYPHKNLSILLLSLRLSPTNLVMVSKSGPYLTKLLSQQSQETRNRITILEQVSEADLAYLYAHAKALIMPSLMEGYGLPGVEALSVGTPVIASDIPVFREVYGENAVYFDPKDPKDLARIIKSVGARSSRPILFPWSWQDLSKRFAEVISESCTSIR